MNWVKKGLIFKIDRPDRLMHSHSQIPTPLKLKDNLYRIYFSSRDINGKTYPYYLDYDLKENRIVNLTKKPLFHHGELGTFDDSGIMPASTVEHNGKIYLYYIGWNPQVTVSYRLSIGLAISDDGGDTFYKFSNGPILDRSIEEPFFNTAPCVLKDEAVLKMWYVSCTGWRIIDKKPEPLYLIRQAISDDGIIWNKTNKPAIDYKFDGEAIGRPWVIKDAGLYKMWYSSRGSRNYRGKDGEHYIIGYAESLNGMDWLRKDESAGIAVSESGWDSEMIEYCSVVKDSGKKYMFYNGNGFGESGFGYAEF